ncbi:MAG TPA: HAMP domain-containing sensor histidine kinase [Polyangiaceae bacterium]
MRLPRPAPWSWLVLSTGVVVLAFVVAALVAWHRSAAIDEMAQAIATDADPGIRHLVEARTELHVMDTLVTSGLLDATRGKRGVDHDAFEESKRRLHGDLHAYLQLSLFPEARVRWHTVESELGEAETRLDAVVAKLDAGDNAGASALRDGGLGRSLQRADGALGAQIAFEADHASHLGEEIEAARREAQQTSYVLHALAVAVTLVVVGMSVGASRRYVAVLRDAAEAEACMTRKLEAVAAELRQEVARREDLVSIVSHDLRNPLSAVGMAARTLRRSLGPEAPARKQVDMIARNVTRMDRLIADLLAVAKLQEGGTLPIEPSAQDAGAIVGDVIDVFAASAADKGIELRSVLTRDLPPAYCDGGRIAQVLSNLVGNALKFTPRGGSVIVTVDRAEADDVRFSVRDTGVGIPEEAVPHVFERFWQNERHRARGTGLGLYIAKGIIDAHHGHIWVTSRVGEGSDFQFTVPAASWPEEPSYGLQVAPAKPAMT